MVQAKSMVTQKWRCVVLALALAGLAGCETATSRAGSEPPEPGVLKATRNGPPGAAPGSCWGKTVSPAVIERVRQQVQIKPAQINPDGTIANPPVYRTEDRQVIVTPRKDNWFETPCPDVMTPEFVSSLQRALEARGQYGGQITGVIDPSTQKAIAMVQKERGLNSPVLSLETARDLGLVAVPRSPSE